MFFTLNRLGRCKRREVRLWNNIVRDHSEATIFVFILCAPIFDLYHVLVELGSEPSRGLFSLSILVVCSVTWYAHGTRPWYVPVMSPSGRCGKSTSTSRHSEQPFRADFPILERWEYTSSVVNRSTRYTAELLLILPYKVMQ